MEVPTRIDLNVSQGYVFRFKGLGTAGYVWTDQILGNDNLISVSRELSTDPLQVNEGGFPIVGSSEDEIFTIKALAPGHVTIHFAQRRPWEKDIPPVKEYTVEVYIQESTTPP